MKRLLLFTCCWFCGVELYAQSDFRPGYILTHKNDTVHGLIGVGQSSKRYEECIFKKHSEAAVEEFTAADIRGYRFIDDRFFVSKSIKSHADNIENAFVELIVRGRISLFRHNDNFYVSKEDSPLYALTNEQVAKNIDGRRVMVESNRYVGLLNHLMSDCESIKQRIRGVKLFEKSLTDIVEEYNLRRDDTPVTFKSGIPFLHASFSAAGGIAISSLAFSKSSPSYEPLQGVFEESISPIKGLSIDLSSPRINDRIAFHAGAYYTSTNTGSFYEVRRNYYVVRHFVDIDMATLQIPLGIRYSLPERNFTPYVNAGILNSYNLRATVNWVKETEVDNVVETEERDDIRLNRNQIGLWAGLGIRKRILPSADLFVEARYSRSLGSVSAAESLMNASPAISGFQFFIGIRTK